MFTLGFTKCSSADCSATGVTRRLKKKKKKRIWDLRGVEGFHLLVTLPLYCLFLLKKHVPCHTLFGSNFCRHCVLT